MCGSLLWAFSPWPVGSTAETADYLPTTGIGGVWRKPAVLSSLDIDLAPGSFARTHARTHTHNTLMQLCIHPLPTYMHPYTPRHSFMLLLSLCYLGRNMFWLFALSFSFPFFFVNTSLSFFLSFFFLSFFLALDDSGVRQTASEPGWFLCQRLPGCTVCRGLIQ